MVSVQVPETADKNVNWPSNVVCFRKIGRRLLVIRCRKKRTLVLLDLSAAFDMYDWPLYNIKSIEVRLGIDGSESYIANVLVLLSQQSWSLPICQYIERGENIRVQTCNLLKVLFVHLLQFVGCDSYSSYVIEWMQVTFLHFNFIA
jgi:hypothetical protein